MTSQLFHLLPYGILMASLPCSDPRHPWLPRMCQDQLISCGSPSVKFVTLAVTRLASDIPRGLAGVILTAYPPVHSNWYTTHGEEDSSLKLPVWWWRESNGLAPDTSNCIDRYISCQKQIMWVSFEELFISVFFPSPLLSIRVIFFICLIGWFYKWFMVSGHGPMSSESVKMKFCYLLWCLLRPQFNKGKEEKK